MTPYDYIKLKIIKGEYKPGDIFNELEVAKSLNTSRTPIREAILRLKEEGYLTIIPRKGTIISNISIQDVKDTYELRMILEPNIAKIACKKMNKESAFYLKNKVEEALKGKEYLIENDFDEEFHNLISESLSNSLINKEIKHLMDLTSRIRFITSLESFSRYQESLKEHLKIINSIIEGNELEAYKNMEEHLKNSLNAYKL